MKMIYGYKEKDVISLAQAIRERRGSTLSELFENFATQHGKAKGTVRNLYYALAKHSKENKEFCEQYLDGAPVQVEKIIEFNDCEERRLIKLVLSGRADGKSVRSVVNNLANGDAKQALRFQNKYRNALKNKPELISQILTELKSEGKSLPIKTPLSNQPIISDAQFKAVKESINGLIFRLSNKLKKENEYLKERVSMLEIENLRLNSLLACGQIRQRGTSNYFKHVPTDNVLN